MVFPVISTTATILVLASFLLPLSMTGTLDTWIASVDSEAGAPEDPTMYVTAFLFYFCNYFAIIFFNTALIASVMDIIEGGKGSLSFGIKFATRRIHSIFGWALISAVIGMILKAIERNEKAGRFISSLLGSAWTALTYFVVPVIVSDGVGPVEAFKRANRAMRDTWGTSLMGNFSMGFLAFLALFPIIGLGIAIGIYIGPIYALVVCVPLVVLSFLASATADLIFKAYLYAYATGKTLPDNVDTGRMGEAFSGR